MRPKSRNSLAAFIALFSLIHLTSGADIYLSPNGNDSNNGLSPSEALFTLNKANELAFDGDNFILLDGLYDWNTTQTLTKAVSVTAAVAAAPTLTSSTISSGSLISISGLGIGSELTIDGITIDFISRSSLNLVGISTTSSLRITNSSIRCNTAAIDACRPLTVTQARIRLETVFISGGAASRFTNASVGSWIMGSVFEESTATADCGSLQVSQTFDELLIQHTMFYGSSALNGGALCSQGSNLRFVGVNCSQNAALRSGGCLYATDVSNITVAQSYFRGNRGGVDTAVTSPRPTGGAIAVMTSGSLVITFSEFIDNGMTQQGGAVAATGSASIRVNSTSFSQNTASYRGGAVYIETGILRVFSSLFARNINTAQAAASGIRGAAISAMATSDILPSIETTIVNSTFYANLANYGALGGFTFGTVHIARRAALIQSSQFLNNTGVIYAALSLFSHNPVVDSCLFLGNQAQQGASMYIDGSLSTPTLSSALIRNTIFEQNDGPVFLPTAATIGAALLVANLARLDVVNSSFVHNRCDGGGRVGGASGCAITVVNSPTNADLKIINSSFHQNEVINGVTVGGFVVAVQQVSPGATVNVLFEFTNFTHNRITNTGQTALSLDASCGVAYVYVGAGSSGFYNVSAEYRDSIFDSNHGRIGGAFCALDSSARAVRSKFINNVASGPFPSIVMFSGGSPGITGNDNAQAVFEDCIWANNTGQFTPDSTNTMAMDLLTGCFLPDRKQIDVSFVGGNVFSQSPPPEAATNYFVSNLQLISGSLKFIPPALAPPNHVIQVPTLFVSGNMTVDARAGSFKADFCRLWWTDTALTPVKLLIGDYDVVCGSKSSLCYSDVIGFGAGKLIMEARGDLASCDQFTPRFTNVVLENRGLLDQWNATVILLNTTIINSPGAQWRAPLWSQSARTVSHSAAGTSRFDNYGILRAALMIFSNMHVVLHDDTSDLYIQITNFWTPSGFILQNSSTVEVGGEIWFLSAPVRDYTEPSFNQSFPLLLSNSSGALSGGDFQDSWFSGGYFFTVDFEPGRSNAYARVVGFYPVSMQLQPDGQNVMVKFPRPAKVSQINCTDVFVASTIAALDSSPVCTWSDSSSLNVRSTKFPPTLTVRPGAIVDAFEPLFQWDQYFDFVVSDPLTRLAPAVVISAPSAVTACANVSLDSRASVTYGDPSVAIYKWSVTDNQDALSLQAFVAASSGSVLLLQPALFPAQDRTYTVCLNITNSMMQWSQSCIQFSRSGTVVPLVSIEGPKQRAPSSIDAFAIHARVDIPSCITQPTSLGRQWVQIGGPSPLIPPLGSSEFSLFFPARSLQANEEYVYEFQSWITPTEKASQQVAIRPASSNIVISSVGASGLVSSNAPVQMAIEVLDPTTGYTAVQSSSVAVSWDVLTCPGRASDGKFTSALAEAYLARRSPASLPPAIGLGNTGSSGQLLPSTLDASILCRDGSRTIRLSSGTGLSYSLNSEALPEGDYLFGVSARMSGNRTARAVVSVTADSSASFLPVSIKSDQPDPTKVLPQEKLSIAVSFNGSSVIPPGLNLRWVDELSDPGLIYPENLLVDEWNPVLVVKPDVLVPGQIYSIKAEITNDGVLFGSNRLFVLPNKAPTSGRISLMPQAPTQFDRVEIVASSWVDEETPLSYLYSLKVPNYAGEIFLSDVTDAPSITTLVPVTGTASLILRIADTNGASTEYTRIVSFLPPTLAVPTLDSFVTRLAWGDVRTASQLVTAIILSSNTPLPNSTIETIVFSLRSFTQSGQLTPSNVQSILTALSVSCMDPRSINAAAATNASEILDIIVSLAERQPIAERTFSGSNSKLGSIVATSFLSTVASVTRSVASNSEISPTTRAALFDVVLRIASLQGLRAAVDEFPQNITTPFLNTTSQVLSSPQPMETPIGIVTVATASSDSDLSIQTLTWAAEAFPYGNSSESAPLRSKVITAQFGGPAVSSITIDFAQSSITGSSSSLRCVTFDESNGLWKSTGCALSLRQTGYSCTCSVPAAPVVVVSRRSAASGSPQQRISLSLLLATDAEYPPVSGPPGSPNNGGATIDASSGLSVGAAAGIAVVVVLIATVAIVFVLWWRKKEAVLGARNKILQALGRGRNAAPSDSTTTSTESTMPLPSDAPKPSNSGRWTLASRPSVTKNVVDQHEQL